ncbi:PEP-CTERM sorting domain-containing protein [Verrucomicrobiaceae bacterium N1E253]|uniref:PEP-CTERM sorting domain-containing protein n=1 Tax=Oceaniferula marina TaxID=2748318 RepID=A0A851GBD1_9BACT|nr:PEP-CTERM sorting domain-containing protein [Oceaniferula marina]NWK55058.1 PEP-CTERM sorting domain-containing protein [Oceaniferula marina]
MIKQSTSIALLVGLSATTQAASISVNFSVSATVDNQRVDAGETALVGLSGTEAVDGSNWNNISTRLAGDPGDPGTFRTSTQGGASIALIDSSGASSGVNMTSSGTFYTNYANASSPNQGATGDGGLLQGYLNLNDTETISLTGLSTWAPNGYKAFAVFDIGGLTRTYGISMNDGGALELYWTADNSTDSDTNNDGIIDWLGTTSTTSGSAVTNANYASFGTFTGDTLTISGTNNGGRAVLSGFQIVAVPEPSSAALLGLGGLALILHRRK